jgi:glycosidase
MKYDTLQIMVYGKNLKDVKVTFDHSTVNILSTKHAENPNYLFIDAIINSSYSLDSYSIYLKFVKGEQDTTIEFPLLPRQKSKNNFQGFNNSDAVYLIMADRFCDGNPANNKIDDSLDQFSVKDIDGRKGGDIAGIISKLDYIKDLGATTIWITPMLENNMWMSYHGYAATDLYKIDPRFGSKEIYKQLVDEAHKKDLKIIMDHVSNHIGINHWWMNELPFKDWINGTEKNHLNANHNKMTFPDPYSSAESVDLTWDGWFADYMVDLNQANQNLKKYLIQNTIWWIEYLGIDGIREDTYPYCNQYYLSDWAKVILSEYPDFNIVGEIWTGEPTFLAAYQQNNKFGLKLNSHLPCVTDFALADAMRNYLSGKKGLEGIFNILAQDYIYYDSNNLLTFFDNHDITRGLFEANGDVKKFETALAMLLTTRGIPKILYGTEIGIYGDEKHGNIRSPFPGGFKEDVKNSFNEEGRNETQKEIFNFTKIMLELRKNYPSLSKGKLIHFYPFNNVYTYFRFTDTEKIMIIINGNESAVNYDLSLYKLELKEYNKFKNLFTNRIEKISDELKININGKSANIFLLTK